MKAERTLNDHVEDIHRALVSNERYTGLLRAVYDAHAVEGSLSADNTLAAMMIREKAAELNNVEVMHEKLAVINSALNIVLRRYKASRKQRRHMVGGRIIPDDDNGA